MLDQRAGAVGAAQVAALGQDRSGPDIRQPVDAGDQISQLEPVEHCDHQGLGVIALVLSVARFSQRERGAFQPARPLRQHTSIVGVGLVQRDQALMTDPLTAPAR